MTADLPEPSTPPSETKAPAGRAARAAATRAALRERGGRVRRPRPAQAQRAPRLADDLGPRRTPAHERRRDARGHATPEVWLQHVARRRPACAHLGPCIGLGAALAETLQDEVGERRLLVDQRCAEGRLRVRRGRQMSACEHGVHVQHGAPRVGEDHRPRARAREHRLDLERVEHARHLQHESQPALSRDRLHCAQERRRRRPRPGCRRRRPTRPSPAARRSAAAGCPPRARGGRPGRRSPRPFSSAPNSAPHGPILRSPTRSGDGTVDGYWNSSGSFVRARGESNSGTGPDRFDRDPRGSRPLRRLRDRRGRGRSTPCGPRSFSRRLLPQRRPDRA